MKRKISAYGQNTEKGKKRDLLNKYFTAFVHFPSLPRFISNGGLSIGMPRQRRLTGQEIAQEQPLNNGAGIPAGHYYIGDEKLCSRLQH